MPSLNEFSRRIEIRADRIGVNTTRLVRATALAADQAIVTETPVDTGRARSNWIVEINAPASAVISAYTPGEGASTAAENTTAALAQGEAVIRGYQSGRDSEIHITNNLPYIEKLNNGSSAQAPANFIQKAIDAAVRVIRSGRIIDP